MIGCNTPVIRYESVKGRIQVSHAVKSPRLLLTSFYVPVKSNNHFNYCGISRDDLLDAVNF